MPESELQCKTFLRESPDKGWKFGGLNYFLRKFDKTDSCVR